jgi:hypothetical protein
VLFDAIENELIGQEKKNANTVADQTYANNAKAITREYLYGSNATATLVKRFVSDYLLFGTQPPEWAVGAVDRFKRLPPANPARGNDVVQNSVTSTAMLMPSHDFEIQRVYYINLDSEKKRRVNMEKWLSKANVPFERIKAQVLSVSDSLRDTRCGDPSCPQTGCTQQEPHRCRGIRGLIASNVHIMDTKNISGLTLVLEDDFKLNIKALSAAIQRVPKDWDVIRFNCKGSNHLPQSFDVARRSECPKYLPLIFKTQHVRPVPDCNKEPCAFCGGTHATLWRGKESVAKLRAVWSATPYQGIDCALTTDRLQSYCVQGVEGAFDKQTVDKSSIPKQNQAWSEKTGIWRPFQKWVGKARFLENGTM